MALKSTRYRKVAPAALNRRSQARHAVRITAAALERRGSLSVDAKLLDISIYGCRFEADALFKEGEQIKITLAEHEPVVATLIWQKAKQMGCRFGQALDSDLLRTLTLAG